MNQQIIDGNKLIAEFDGVPTDLINNIVKYSEYHTDWNWLMPIIKKIEAIREKEFIVTIFGTHCTIEDSQIFIATVVRSTKIMATYMAVKRFIKWYNKERK